MRMMITLQLEKNILPRDYRPWVRRLFHDALSRQGGENMVQLHLDTKAVKLFSFSVYLPKSRFGQEIMLESNYIKVIFSAFDENTFDDFFLALMGMQGQQSDMGVNQLRVASVMRILEKSVQQPQIGIHMLSPLVVRGLSQTKQEGRGCLGVKDTEFEASLRTSVADLLPAAGLSNDVLSSLRVLIGPEASYKEAHVLHKGNFFRSTLGDLQLSGEPALLNLLYHAGMGEMREDGFGLFELLP